jgi:hypothetical protein
MRQPKPRLVLPPDWIDMTDHGKDVRLQLREARPA